MADDDPTTTRSNETPWFPFTISLQGVSVTLLADGKWEGSLEAFREVLATTKGVGLDGLSRVLLWLVLREMERDRRFW